jgi:hypothetical protein
MIGASDPQDSGPPCIAAIFPSRPPPVTQHAKPWAAESRSDVDRIVIRGIPGILVA